MSITSKRELRGFALRMAEDERTVAERVKASAEEAGLKGVSLNDVIRHLIRRAEVSPPRTVREGIHAIQEHWVTCGACEPYTPPRCLDGLYLRELNVQASRAEQGRAAVA